MKKLALALSVALLLVLTPRTAAAFCGFYVSGADTKMFNNATQVVMMRDGLRTVLSMQNNYEGPPENFAMVVPVPVILQKDNVKTLPREIFDRVDALDAPRLVEYWEQDPCASVQEQGKMGMMEGSRRLFSAHAKSASDDFGVTVEAQFTVGEYEIVILSAKDGLGLEGWLNDQKYKIPEGSAAFFKPYIDQGSKFFVAKVDVSKVKFENGMAMLSPLRFHYDSDRFSLPVRLGLMNAKSTQDLVVHILAKKQRFEVSNYNNVFIPTNLDVSDATRESFGSFYAALLDRTLEKNPKSVVTEYSWDAATCDPCPVPGLTPGELATLGDDVTVDTNAIDAGTQIAPGSRHGFRRRGWSPWVVTRLHARYTKESLGEDLVFRAAEPITGGRETFDATGVIETTGKKSAQNNFQARYVIRHAWTGALACKEPHRGVWGPPPPGSSATTASTAPVPARNLAFVKRGDTSLASFVRSRVPELGIEGPAPGKEIEAAKASTDVPPPKKDCGCGLVSRVDTDARTLAACALCAVAFVVRRRKSKSKRKMHCA